MFLPSPLFRRHGIRALFTTRLHGFSRGAFASLNLGFGLGDDQVERNLEKLVLRAGLGDTPHQARQVHGTAMLECSGPGRLHGQEADALWSSAPDTPLAVRTADCLPVLLADPEAGLVAAVHAGWRGTAGNIIGRTVAALQRHNARAERMIASLGPCIGPCCFDIGSDVAQALRHSTDGAEAFIHAGPDGRLAADLAAINHRQLLAAGLAETRIEHIHHCNSCESGLFFSHRRDHGNCGRMLAVVVRPASP